MALTPLGSNQPQRNNCIFGAIRPFDTCRTYGNPCSSDASQDDGWFICEYHLSIRFRMEKMVLPIPDGEGTIYNRSVGKSLVSESDENRILIPTATNYEEVLKLPSMSLPEQLIFHMIYDQPDKQNNICKLLQYNENFHSDLYQVVEQVYNKTAGVLAKTNPERFCARVNTNNYRTYGSADDTNVSNITYNALPGFLKNLIFKSVAPCTMDYTSGSLQLRNAPTCAITEQGLVASADIYNPVVPKYVSGYQENILKVDNVLRFKGNAVALQSSLSRYEHYPLVVPLMLGSETLITRDTYKKPIYPNIVLTPTVSVSTSTTPTPVVVPANA
ncbi:Vp39 [Helicoverpa armigera multiple nucleopolyhedrovirus]|uniref:Vp39 n=1 Tax=Mamestra brassicae nuclear polyhedrosis virus TaxID=78219 RepID=A0A077CZ56_NPVMB|nr:Vp39 [Helicoverpa armigera multiple nucleopolyhedrovirus]AIL25169.1 vp39 [Mamestra brassicae multiple nucleopolyhedrovirus]